MQRFMPQQGMQPPMGQMSEMSQMSKMQPQGPSFSGSAQPNYQPQAQQPWAPPQGFAPRVVIGDPPTAGTDAALSGGSMSPYGNDAPPSALAPAPSGDLLEQLRRLLGGGGPSAPPDSGQPLF